MHFIWHGLQQAWGLLLHPNADLRSIIKVTVRLALESAALALLIGVPIGLALGIARFRGRRFLLALANAGLGLPPVLVGLVAFLLLAREGPLGRFNLVYTVNGMVLAQTVLNIPIVVALMAAGAQAVSSDLLTQAKALGASWWQAGILALREARVSLFVAALAAVGAACSEVGAVIVVGGNIDLQTRTVAGAILTSISEGRYDEAIALGTVLLGIVFLLAAGLTIAQQGGQHARPDRRVLRHP